ncbi:MAG: hypothetical protein KA252_00195 [Sphingorhabdus sp.]|nr:hypothetical protein [Sphingorhabdus sp.]
MKNFIKRALAIFAVFGGALVATATPAMANENKAVLCGWQKQKADGTRVGTFYRNSLTAKSPTITMTDDQWQRAQCDGADGKKGAIDRIADNIKAQQGNMDGWSEQRYQTTWADRCTNSDPVALWWGIIWDTKGCVNYVKGKVNYATSGQATPHDLLSCMYDGRTYNVTYDWNNITFQDVDNKKILVIPNNQLNCVGEPAYMDPPKK